MPFHHSLPTAPIFSSYSTLTNARFPQEAIVDAERHRERVAEAEKKLEDETSAKLVAESGEKKASGHVMSFVTPPPRAHAWNESIEVLVLDILGGSWACGRGVEEERGSCRSSASNAIHETPTCIVATYNNCKSHRTSVVVCSFS